MGDIRIKILLDGRWTNWMTSEEARRYEFTECVIEETMTRKEYNKHFTDSAEQRGAKYVQMVGRVKRSKES